MAYTSRYIVRPKIGLLIPLALIALLAGPCLAQGTGAPTSGSTMAPARGTPNSNADASTTGGSGDRATAPGSGAQSTVRPLTQSPSNANGGGGTSSAVADSGTDPATNPAGEHHHVWRWVILGVIVIAIAIALARRNRSAATPPPPPTT